MKKTAALRRTSPPNFFLTATTKQGQKGYPELLVEAEVNDEVHVKLEEEEDGEDVVEAGERPGGRMQPPGCHVGHQVERPRGRRAQHVQGHEHNEQGGQRRLLLDLTAEGHAVVVRVLHGHVAFGERRPPAPAAHGHRHRYHHDERHEQRHPFHVPEVHDVVLLRGRGRRLLRDELRPVGRRVEHPCRLVFPEARQRADEADGEDHDDHDCRLVRGAERRGPGRGDREDPLEAHHDQQPDGAVPEPVPTRRRVRLGVHEQRLRAYVVLKGQ